MNHITLPPWLQQLVAALGGGGLFLVTFFDSSLLSFPLVADALVIEVSMHKPARMPFYCAMAALGSLAGCIWLYLLAKKGGEAFFHRSAGRTALQIKRWVQSNAFLSAFLPAILPPPVPFKPFILAEGVFQVPLRTFAVALLLGRGLRYFIEGILAVRYGEAVLVYLLTHKGRFALAAVAIAGLAYFLSRLLNRDESEVH
jgi:membrane protein YqaA with SNARE-associated domain